MDIPSNQKRLENIRKFDEDRFGTENYNEIRKAKKRLGLNLMDLAKWMVNFGSADLEELSAGGRLDLLWEYRVFRLIANVVDRLGYYVGTNTMINKGWEENTGILEVSDDDDSRMVLFHGFLAKGFERLRLGERWDFPYKQTLRLEYLVTYLHLDNETDYTEEYHAIQILRMVARQFRFCQECSRPFIAIKRQIYCGPKCSAVVRNRKYWEANKEKLKEARRKKK